MRATPKIRENPMARRANVLPLMRPLMMMSIMRAIWSQVPISKFQTPNNIQSTDFNNPHPLSPKRRGGGVRDRAWNLVIYDSTKCFLKKLN
jgi:hypothetical protein